MRRCDIAALLAAGAVIFAPARAVARTSLRAGELSDAAIARIADFLETVPRSRTSRGGG